jgi:hypothetical protein
MCDYFVIVCSTKYKPRIALVRNATVSCYGESTLQQRAFDPIELSKLLLTPIA